MQEYINYKQKCCKVKGCMRGKKPKQIVQSTILPGYFVIKYEYILGLINQATLINESDKYFHSKMINMEPWHGISNNVVCATSKALNYRAALCSL